jgi:hypothetical protein
MKAGRSLVLASFPESFNCESLSIDGSPWYPKSFFSICGKDVAKVLGFFQDQGSDFTMPDRLDTARKQTDEQAFVWK